MLSEDRPIHFSTELMHVPKQHDAQVLKKLYLDLSESRQFAYDSCDLTGPAGKRLYSKRGQKTQSVFAFAPDRLALVEEWVDMPLSRFLDKVKAVVPPAMEALGIPFIVAQTAIIRTTFALTHFEDARAFLVGQVCNQEDAIARWFQRPIAVGGLRFVLPEIPDKPGNLHVLIESYRHSQNEVFVEVRGVFAQQRIAADGIEQACDHILLARQFISESVFPFLDNYDKTEDDFV